MSPRICQICKLIIILNLAAKTISSAVMLTRRKSSITGGGDTGGSSNIGNGPAGFSSATSRVQAARESVAVLAELLTMDSMQLKRNFSGQFASGF